LSRVVRKWPKFVSTGNDKKERPEKRRGAKPKREKRVKPVASLFHHEVGLNWGETWHLSGEKGNCKKEYAVKSPRKNVECA